MNEPLSIDKKRPDPRGLDFQTLKKEGISFIQELCGNIWTDYNLHDPGVTILEQLCYGLTDLVYRTEFATADYLTGEDGTIDLARLALHQPAEVFPSQPVTVNDLRKIFFDEIPEIDNIWVRTEEQEGVSGLYQFDVQLVEKSDPLKNGRRDDVLDRIRAVFCANRNLCEDMDRVQIVEPRYHTLHGSVEIDNSRPPETILAEIYFRCGQLITPPVISKSYREMMAQGLSPEELFTGPLCRHGYIDEDESSHQRRFVTILDLIGIAGDIAGVYYVQNLYVRHQNGDKVESIIHNPASGNVPRLYIPKGDDEIGIRLFKNQREHRVAVGEFRAELARRNAEHRSWRDRIEDLSGLLPPPQGTFRNFRNYYSIQNQFPGIYGINTAGIPDSKPDARKAEARQLKAYLLFFEQIMANFQANIQAIPDLFSLDEGLKTSYFHQLLDNKKVADVESIYQGKLPEIEARIARTVKDHDPFYDRRNRVLDYLLALYGEKFSQNSLRLFNYYFSEEEVPGELISNKLILLKNIIETSRNRASGFNYSENSSFPGNISGLQRKTAILLAMNHCQSPSLTAALAEDGLSLVTDEEFAHHAHQDQERREAEGSSPVETDAQGQWTFMPLPPSPSRERDISRLGAEISFLKEKPFSGTMLRKGILSDSYRIGSREGSQTCALFMIPDKTKPRYQLASYATKEEATDAAEDLRRFLIGLNRKSEGLHIVEHLLLRPVKSKKHTISVPEDFYSFRISVIFPLWTARCDDKEFRKLAEETLVLNCPAHIAPSFLWLDFKKMGVFETRYQKWLREKHSPTDDCAPLDQAAEEVITFLLDHRHGNIRPGAS